MSLYCDGLEPAESLRKRLRQTAADRTGETYTERPEDYCLVDYCLRSFTNGSIRGEIENYSFQH